MALLFGTPRGGRNLSLHRFRVIKRQLGLMEVRFRGLAKNTAHVVTLFAMSNLWMAREQLMAMGAAFRPRTA